LGGGLAGGRLVGAVGGKGFFTTKVRSHEDKVVAARCGAWAFGRGCGAGRGTRGCWLGAAVGRGLWQRWATARRIGAPAIDTRRNGQGRSEKPPADAIDQAGFVQIRSYCENCWYDRL